MVNLEKGRVIKTRDAKKLVVEERLGEGGQGAVYRINYNNSTKAFNGIRAKKFKNPDKFYKNLENNIKKGKPTESFLWPEDI